MREQVVRAGKCVSVGFILIAALPVLLPWLVFFSFFSFAFVLPMGCALTGLLYLRKYAEVLYGILSTAGSWGADSQELHIASATRVDATLTEFFPKDDSLEDETVEDVDQEFDAVVVSTAPREVPQSEDAGGNGSDGNGSEAFPVAGIPAEDGTGRERTDDSEQMVEEDGVGSPGVDSFIEEFAAHENSADTKRRGEEQEEGSPEQLAEEDDRGSPAVCSFVKEFAAENSVDNERRGEEREELRPTQLPEDLESRPFHSSSVQDKFFGSLSGNGDTRGAEEDEGLAEDRLAVADSADSADSVHACIFEEKRVEERSSQEDLGRAFDGRTDSTATERRGDSQGEVPGEAKHIEKGALLGTAEDDIVEAYPTVDTLERSYKHDGEKIPGEKETEEKEDHFETVPVDGLQLNEDQERPHLSPIVPGGNEAGQGIIEALYDGRVLREADEDQERQDVSPIVQGGSDAGKERMETLWSESAFREADEDQEERQDLSPIAPGASGAEQGKREALSDGRALREAVEDQKKQDVSPIAPGVSEAGKERIECLWDKRAFRKVDEDQESQDVTPIAPGDNEEGMERIDEKPLREADDEQERYDVSPIAPVSISGASYALVNEEVSTKSDRNETQCAGNFLHDQAHEDGTQICRECGWKCANFRSSAKTLGNHKHCNGVAPTAPDPQAGISTTEPPLDVDCLTIPIEASVKMETDLKAVPSPDSAPEEFGGSFRGEHDRSATAEPDPEGGRSVGAVISCLESTKELDAESIPPEHGSASPDSLRSEGSDDDLGSGNLQPSSSPTEQSSHSLPAASRRTENDERFLDYLTVLNKSVALDPDATLSGVPSAQEDESETPQASESFRSVRDYFPAVASESFRSASDEFPDDCGSWSTFPPDKTDFAHEQDQLAQFNERLQLRLDLNAMKRIVGDQLASAGPLLTDIEELSEVLGIELPVRSADLPQIEWAKVAIEVMKIVVGMD